MTQEKKSKNTKAPNKGTIIRSIILIVSSILAFLALVIPDIIDESAFQMQVGEVTSQEILAPYSLTFTSEVLTENAKKEAADSTVPIYIPADPSIGRHQIEGLRAVLYYINTVRQDKYATNEQKLSDLESIQNIDLSENIANSILTLNQDKWESIGSEAAKVLEEVMRNTIRANDLSVVKNNVPSIINYSFSEEHANIIIELVLPFIVPNSLFSEELTKAAQDRAVAAVEPISRSFITGETLVRRGEILKSEDLEALDKYGLIRPENEYQEWIASLILVALIAIFIGFYFSRRKMPQLKKIKSVLLISATFLTFLILARFFVIDRTIIPYVFPISAFSLTLIIIFNLEIGIVFTIALGILLAYNSARGLDLTVFYILPSILGMLAIGKARRITSFLISGIVIGISGVAIIFAFRLGDSLSDWIGIASLSSASVLNGLASASLTLFLQYVYSQILDITTPLQLLDLSRTDHPLLQKILRDSPGSYQHSLQVANLAEHAAEAIGADVLLVRVGAIYHDCGKSANPQFFIENQVNEKINSHDDIDPATAAATIIQHIIDGVTLGKKYHLPTRVIDFIKEHHGTLLTQYQYNQALKNASDPEEIDKNLFRYPGPKPNSRETAILMLSDGTEARARAEKPKDEIELKNLIRKVMMYYQTEEQLVNTDLTLRDLTAIEESFFNTLRNVYHPRIQYPVSRRDAQKANQT